MDINKNYYFGLSATGEIVNGECDHKAITKSDLAKFQAVLQPVISDGSLFTGKDLKVKKVKSYNVATQKMQESVIVTNYCNLEFEQGKITVAEHNTGKSQLRVWYRAEGYEKPEAPEADAETGTSDDPEL